MNQGFGAMRLRDDSADDPDRDPVAVVQAALDAGVMMVDTADAYQNEALVGRAIKGRREEVTLASKFGLVWQAEAAGGFDVRADANYVQHACEASLRRLDVEAIDLYYLHHRSERVPIEETVGAMAGLVRQGKVRSIGLSNVTAADLRRAHAVHPIAALQEQWSLVERGVEQDLLPTAVELGTTVVAHSPNGHGLLHAQPSGAAAGRSQGLSGVLAQVADTHEATPGQVALAWVHHRQEAHGVTVVPIPGTTSIRHLRVNLAAAELSLSSDELHRLDAATG
ncbi:aldo/keto reductase [Knoellia sp. S7-12]|uniref:aldo/keto reductase n=1 Tax=Knoellia sp. S7-12 TaxID=3126698 RepID=UPI0033694D65